MRELGFSQRWPKLKQPAFTTFRCPRQDRDWHQGELVRVVYRPRSREREVLGYAEIVSREPRTFLPAKKWPQVTKAEAIEDGFDNLDAMKAWLYNAHGEERLSLSTGRTMNKLTLEWRRPLL